MRSRALSLLALSLLTAGCANGADSSLLAGFLLGLPDEAIGGGNNAELTVFLARGASPLEVAANTIEDADLVFGASEGRVVALPHISDGFYIRTSIEDPALRYVHGASWEVGADVDSQRVEVRIETPAAAGLFGSPLDGSWSAGRELVLTLGAEGTDRAFAWVNGPTGEVTWTDEPPNTGALLQWLATEPGVSSVVIPGVAFPVAGTYRVVVVATSDADPDRFRGVSNLSRFSMGLATELSLDVQ